MISYVCINVILLVVFPQETLRIHVLRTKIHPDAFLYSCTLCSRNHTAAANKELLSKDLNSSVFRTNKYSELKAHVQRQHSDNPWVDSDQGIYVLAGLRKVCPPSDYFPIVIRLSQRNY